MRALGFAAAFIVASWTSIACALGDGAEAPAFGQSVMPVQMPRQAPVPVTAWAGLVIFGGILTARHIRRRQD